MRKRCTMALTYAILQGQLSWLENKTYCLVFVCFLCSFQRNVLVMDYPWVIFKFVDCKTCRIYLVCPSTAYHQNNIHSRGGYLTKFNTGRLRPEVQPLTLLYTILQKRYPFYITFIEKSYSFHIPTCNSVIWLNHWERNSWCHFHVVLNK